MMCSFHRDSGAHAHISDRTFGAPRSHVQHSRTSRSHAPRFVTPTNKRALNLTCEGPDMLYEGLLPYGGFKMFLREDCSDRRRRPCRRD